MKILEGIVTLFKEDDSILELIPEETVKRLKLEIEKSLVWCNLTFVGKILEALSVLPLDSSDIGLYW